MLRKKTSAIPDEQATARAQAAEQKQTSAILAALRAIHSAASPDSMEPEDLELSPFDRRGGLGRFYEVFGAHYEDILREMNVELVA